MTEERDDIGDVVNHLRGVGFLSDAAVYGELHIEILHIVHLVFCEQVRSHGQEAVRPFAVEPVVKLVPGSPGPSFSEGDTSCGDVVDDGVAGHCIEGVLGLYTLGRFADYDGQFDFVIHLLAIGGPGDLLIGADDDGRGHNKGPRHSRFARRIGESKRTAGVFYMLAVVSRQCDCLVRPGDGGEELYRIERGGGIG